MPSILAFGRTTQATSLSGIPTAYDQLAPNGASISTFLSIQQILTNPTFAGISSLVPQLNGSLLASWSAGSTPNPTIEYDVYIQLGTATGLFNAGNRTRTTFGTSIYLFTLADSATLLVAGSTYFVGIRARDPLGNQSTNTTSVSAVSTGVSPSRYLALTDIPSIVSSVWSELQAGYSAAGSFGNLLDSKASLTKAVADTIDSKLGSPVGSSFSADYQSIQTGVNTTNNRLGTPVGVNFSADIASIKADEVTTLARLTPTRAANLDNLDASVTSRLSDSVANIRFTAVDTAISSNLTAIQGIQNNTNFVGIVPSILSLPDTGSTIYKFFANLFDTVGSPEDPDSNIINYRIENSSGTIIVATTAMTRDSIGVYRGDYVVNSGDSGVDLVFIFTYTESSVAFIQYRTTRVQSSSGDLGTLLARLTPARAANLDNLDALISSRLSEADSVTHQSALLTQHANSQTAIAAVSTKIGTPVFGSVTQDVSAVRVQTDKIGNPANTTLAADLASIKSDSQGLRTDYTGLRATNLDNLDALVSSRQSESSALTRYNTLNNNDVGIIVAVNSIQNDTSFVGVVPNPFERPASGSTDYALFANLFDSVGSPNDPDLNTMYYRIEDPTGGIVAPTMAMTRLGVGKFKAIYSVLSTDPLIGLIVFFEYNELSTPFRQIRTTFVGATETKLDTINNKLGVPVATVSLDIAGVKSVMDTINSNSNANQTYNSNALASIQSDTDNIQAKIGIPLVTLADDIQTSFLKATDNDLVGIVEDEL